MLTGSWWNVKASTISNCWQKAGLLETSLTPQDCEPTPRDCDDEVELDPELWNELTKKLPVDAAVTFEDYVDSDCAAATSAELTCKEIGDCGVPRSLEGTPTTVEDGNRCRDSSATTATIRNVARIVLRLTMTHLYEASQETLQSNCRLIASDDQILMRRFHVPPPAVTVPPPLFPSASASSFESTRASLPPKPSTSPPLSRSYANHSDAKTAAPTPSSPAASSSSATPLYYRSLRPQAKSSYLSSYQASALPEDEYNSYGKPASHTNGSSRSSSSVTADTSARHLAESSTKKSEWEMMPPPSQTKPTPPRISSLGKT
ncbi:hypothetical protein HPB52_013097 [Rhipicephalus sanguineus]|uniref:Uncharacterized protein n=1 Tax=Rhipicephalus sanguineus TaxID=34632 RepID=A0A9D4Q002_RHISA|nr:hypothetical protein HPB52_013097 [Rhipicephalus sanguineus]